MNTLSKRDLHLVSLGASIGCNCIPCTVYHLRECRSAGLTDEELAEAIRVSNNVKDVPRNNVTQTALRQLKSSQEHDSNCGDESGGNGNPCGCH